MESSKSFKKGDRVRHKFRDEDVLMVVEDTKDGVYTQCALPNGVTLGLFSKNLKLDKNSIIYDIIQQL